MALDPGSDLHELFRTVVDVESVSHREEELADLVDEALRRQPHLEVTRVSNSIVARTHLGRDERVVIAGHLDTVPVDGNLPSRVEERRDGVLLVGRGTCDMKGGVAVALHLAARLTEPVRDVTWVFYEAEEVAARYNGLGLLAAHDPSLLDADLAVLMEPTDARVEGGCQGTMRFLLTLTGKAAHSARAWTGHNAIHDLAEVLEILRRWNADDHEVEVEGLTYREGLNATTVEGGLAGNVIPDRVRLQVNYRFAPDKSAARAEAMMREMFASWPMEVLDLSSPARPGLDRDLARSFVAAVGTDPRPKYGWTDVARFSDLGVPALNYGPGDPSCAHQSDESCRLGSLDDCAAALERWLGDDRG